MKYYLILLLAIFLYALLPSKLLYILLLTALVVSLFYLHKNKILFKSIFYSLIVTPFIVTFCVIPVLSFFIIYDEGDCVPELGHTCGGILKTIYGAINRVKGFIDYLTIDKFFELLCISYVPCFFIVSIVLYYRNKKMKKADNAREC